MPEMGRYLKAYAVERFREYPDWSRLAKEIEDRPYLYVQDDYTVTGGIFRDEEVVFSLVTSEWIAFCREVLRFEIPVWEPSPAQETTH
jgi:hypothetical protein